MTTLPAGFLDYEEKRREGFLKVKELKDQGENIVGMFCSYTPMELVYAAGAKPIGLCGTSEEFIPAAERDLPKNLCPLIKSSYGAAVSEKCPFFYFADMVVGETTCDGKKKMYELLGEMKPVHVMHLPQGQGKVHAFDYWKEEMIEFKNALEKQFNVEITEEKLRESIKQRNYERKVILDFYELGKLNPCPVSGYELNNTMEVLGLHFDREQQCQEIVNRTRELREKYERELKGTVSNRPRLLITGCPLGGVREKIVKTLEDAGADVVAFDSCSGVREKKDVVDETIDPIDALTKKYLNISCSVMTPNPGRLETLDTMIDEYQVDGVVEVILQTCLTFSVEAFQVSRLVKAKKGKPYISIETDYSKTDIGQINTRLNAFVEML